MKRIKSIANILAVISILGLGLSGCVPTYDIKPIYNKATKELRIGTLKLDDVDELYNKSPVRIENGSFWRNSGNYSIFNDKCNRLSYNHMGAGVNSYITNSIDDDMASLIKKRKISCNVTEISNLRFYECKSNNIFKIGSSFPSGLGYADVLTIYTDHKCFNTIKEHFLQKEIIDKVEIKNYIIDNKSKVKYNKNGYDKRGYDMSGYDKEGYDKNGYGRRGQKR